MIRACSNRNDRETVDAILLSGGSAFGLDAAGGAQSALAAAGRGFAVGPMRVPIVPQAIVFDLLNGGDKNWGPARPTGISGDSRQNALWRGMMQRLAQWARAWRNDGQSQGWNWCRERRDAFPACASRP